MGVLVFLVPVVFGIAMVRNHRGTRQVFIKPGMRSDERSQNRVLLLVGWLAILLGSIPILGELVRHLAG